MTPNPVLRKLGFSDSDRVAIIHADDVGMCQATVQAYAELEAFGLVSCGAVMMPCPWALEAGRYARETPQTDLGVHLTLTCEWQYYRWGPISTRDPASGLMDAEGFFPRKSREVQETADPQAARREMEAQIAKARAVGIPVTHLDTHMGSIVHPKLLNHYIELGVSTRTPLMLYRWDAATLQGLGLDAATAEGAAQMLKGLEAQGFPLLDHMSTIHLDKPDQRFEQAKAAFAAMQPGITHFIIHPAADTPELRAIAPDYRARVEDYRTFLREDLREAIQNMGVQVIGYRKLWELLN